MNMLSNMELASDLGHHSEIFPSGPLAMQNQIYLTLCCDDNVAKLKMDVIIRKSENIYIVST